MIRWIIGKLLGEKTLLNREPVNARALCDIDVMSRIRQEVGYRTEKLGKGVEIISHSAELTGIDADMVRHTTEAKLTQTGIKGDQDEIFRKFVYHTTQPIADIRVTTPHGDIEVWQVGSHRIDRAFKSDIVTWSCVAKMVRKFHPA